MSEQQQVAQDQPSEQVPGPEVDMSSQSLRSLFASLRGALTGEGPAAGSRLSLSITSTQPDRPPTGVAGAAQQAAALEEGRDSATAAALATTPLLHTAGTGSSSLPGMAGGAQGVDDVALSDVAAAAEHHRLTNLSSSIDLRAVSVALEHGLPYVTLLWFLFMTTHIQGILIYAYLCFVLFRLNLVISRQVALRQEVQTRPLLGVAGAVAVQVPLVLLVLGRQDILGNLVLAGSKRPSQFFDVVFAVVVGDTLLRFLAVLAKVAVLLSMRADSPARFRRRGHMLTAVEYVWGLYRMLPPTPLWYHYFLQADVGGILRTGLSGAYLLVKAQHVFERAALVVVAVRQLAVRGYGSTPTAEEVQEAGNTCPICQDSYREPLRLSCGHIFCADCCGEWFERERTCPMCRAHVGPANKRFKSFADGRTPLLPLLF